MWSKEHPTVIGSAHRYSQDELALNIGRDMIGREDPGAGTAVAPAACSG